MNPERRYFWGGKVVTLSKYCVISDASVKNAT